MFEEMKNELNVICLSERMKPVGNEKMWNLQGSCAEALNFSGQEIFLSLEDRGHTVVGGP